MSARKASNTVLNTTVDNVRMGDLLLGKRGEVFAVLHAATRAGITRITVWETTTRTPGLGKTWELAHTHLVRVKAEHECECDGSGMWSRGTHNGKPVNAGVHYRCSGKGYQTRKDVARNNSHDNNCPSCTGVYA